MKKASDVNTIAKEVIVKEVEQEKILDKIETEILKAAHSGEHHIYFEVNRTHADYLKMVILTYGYNVNVSGRNLIISWW